MSKQREWKICIDEPFINCQYIYPIQQKKVKSLIEHLSKHENVALIKVFGSSVTPSCHIGSDVDIYVELNSKTDEKLITEYFNFAYDLWTNFTVDEQLKKEIFKTGVTVYEC